jgi:hypothetical protein
MGMAVMGRTSKRSANDFFEIVAIDPFHSREGEEVMAVRVAFCVGLNYLCRHLETVDKQRFMIWRWWCLALTTAVTTIRCDVLMIWLRIAAI